MNIPPIFFLLLPPILGALIGYVTNALAIRMLFRPLTRKYLFGKIPIPLTPGVIPRQREKLAHSIARMVSRNLFNPEVIIQHLRGKKFREALHSRIASFIEPETETETGQIQESVETLHSRIDNIETLVLPLLQDPLGRRIIKRIFQLAGRHIGALNLSKILPLTMKNSKDLAGFIRAQIQGRAFSRVIVTLVLWIRKQEEDNILLEQLFFSRRLNKSVLLFDGWYIPTINFLLEFLRRPEIQRELIKRGKVILSDILMQLNPMQRIVVSAGQYDRTLKENMPAIIRDLIGTLEETLRSKENRQRILEALHEFLKRLASRGLGDLQREYGFSLSRSFWHLFNRLRILLVQEKFAELLAKQISRRGTDSISKLLHSWSGMTLNDLFMEGYRIVIDWIDDAEKRDESKKQLAGLILDAGGAGGAEGGEGSQQGDSLSSPITAATAGLIEGMVPSLVEGFNIYQMVVDRIRGLDAEEVEALLLGIIAEHLKYINILGAVLGAIIGTVQLVLSLLSR